MRELKKGGKPVDARHHTLRVTRGLDPRVHALRLLSRSEEWMAGSSPAMTDTRSGERRYRAAGGTVSTSLPVNTIGPVATPVGEPPSGSMVTA